VFLKKIEFMQKQENKNPKSDKQQRSNDDYKRDNVRLGNSSDTSGSTQKGGGGSGYDVSREQEQVNKEQEIMHHERNEEHLHPERTQNPQPDVNPGRENPMTPSPEKEPEQPSTNPDSNTKAGFNRNLMGGWSQSSWDANSFR
jgi:hypothetical protein